MPLGIELVAHRTDDRLDEMVRERVAELFADEFHALLQHLDRGVLRGGIETALQGVEDRQQIEHEPFVRPFHRAPLLVLIALALVLHIGEQAQVLVVVVDRRDRLDDCLGLGRDLLAQLRVERFGRWGGLAAVRVRDPDALVGPVSRIVQSHGHGLANG